MTSPADTYSLDGEYGPANTDIRNRGNIGGTITSFGGLRVSPSSCCRPERHSTSRAARISMAARFSLPGPALQRTLRGPVWSPRHTDSSIRIRFPEKQFRGAIPAAGPASFQSMCVWPGPSVSTASGPAAREPNPMTQGLPRLRLRRRRPDRAHNIPSQALATASARPVIGQCHANLQTDDLRLRPQCSQSPQSRSDHRQYQLAAVRTIQSDRRWRGGIWRQFQ
jgi:hypothetical protein